MAGPFLNYQMKLDTNEHEYLMLDGFVYSPGSTKESISLNLRQ